jgi:hypothetical protein
MSFDVRAFVVRTGADVALVDTLVRPEHVELLSAALADAGSGFEQVRYVVLTPRLPYGSWPVVWPRRSPFPTGPSGRILVS